jgi:hypothetical protein
MSENFERKDYTSIMKKVYDCVYILPLTNQEIINKKTSSMESNELSDFPLDELFMWSLLLYSGKESEFDLIKYYWSITSKPLACALAAILVFKRFQKESFVTDELKVKLEKVKM